MGDGYENLPAAKLSDEDNRMSLPVSSISLKKYLGEGVFGKVYKGYWGKEGRPVALKNIDLAHAKKTFPSLTKAEMLESLQWEVSRLSTVSHPNCVQFYGTYQNKKGRMYVVMEYCKGG